MSASARAVRLTAGRPLPRGRPARPGTSSSSASPATSTRSPSAASGSRAPTPRTSSRRSSRAPTSGSTTLRDDGALRPWLAQTTRRLSIDSLRRSGREQATEIAARGGRRCLDRAARRGAVRAPGDGRAARQLPGVLDRFFCRDESYRTIGDALDIPPGTIASRISRCLARMRELLGKETGGKPSGEQRHDEPIRRRRDCGPAARVAAAARGVDPRGAGASSRAGRARRVGGARAGGRRAAARRARRPRGGPACGRGRARPPIRRRFAGAARRPGRG